MGAMKGMRCQKQYAKAPYQSEGQIYAQIAQIYLNDQLNLSHN